MVETLGRVSVNFDKKEIESLQKLLSRDENHNNPQLRSIYNKITSNNDHFTMFVDGAADLHSKTSGIGGVVYKDQEELLTFSEYLDDATNNEAEYTALIHGLKLLIKENVLNINIYSDSELVVKQINGQYKVKNQRMKKLYDETISLLSQLDSWTFSHVLRDKNQVADKLTTDGRLAGK